MPGVQKIFGVLLYNFFIKISGRNAYANDSYSISSSNLAAYVFYNIFVQSKHHVGRVGKIWFSNSAMIKNILLVTSEAPRERA